MSSDFFFFQKKMRIPWRHILTSGPVWGTTLAHVGQNWGIWTILTEIPTYFNKALNFDLSNVSKIFLIYYC